MAVVSEGGRPSGSWRVVRTVGHLANGKPRYDPWDLYANHLDVTGNFSKAKIRRTGLMVLQRAAAGK